MLESNLLEPRKGDIIYLPESKDPDNYYAVGITMNKDNQESGFTCINRPATALVISEVSESEIEIFINEIFCSVLKAGWKVISRSQ
jgi:hypothetical protein